MQVIIVNHVIPYTIVFIDFIYVQYKGIEVYIDWVKHGSMVIVRYEHFVYSWPIHKSKLTTLYTKRKESSHDNYGIEVLSCMFMLG